MTGRLLWARRVLRPTEQGFRHVVLLAPKLITAPLITDYSLTCGIHRPGRLIMLLPKNASFQRSPHRFGG
jgi:hypothetical protein